MKFRGTHLAALILFSGVQVLNITARAIAQAPPDLSDPATRRSYIPMLDASIAERPNDPMAYMTRGHLYLFDNRLSQALADFNTANKLKPNDPDIYSGLGVTHLMQNNYPAALAEFNKEIELRPQAAESYNNRGMCWLKLRKVKEAQKDALKAIELSPTSPEAYELLGEIYYAVGNYSASVSYCNEALKRDANNFDAYYYRGCSFDKLGKTALGTADKAKAIKLGYTGRVYLKLKS